MGREERGGGGAGDNYAGVGWGGGGAFVGQCDSCTGQENL